jgi:uncharacterized membrane protein YfhO
MACPLETTALVPDSNRLTPGTAGGATVVADKAGRIRVAVNAPSRQLLVVSERWHKGWQVAVDGTAEAIVRTDGDFICAVAEAGQHVVEFRFWPASLRVGAWLSALGIGLLLALYATRKVH